MRALETDTEKVTEKNTMNINEKTEKNKKNYLKYTVETT